MRRRDFIVLAGMAACMPFAARAQQADRPRRLGILLGNTEGDPQAVVGLSAFRAALQELGWSEGRNLRTDIRWGRADVNRMQAMADELVGLQPDVILAQSTPVVAALQRATRSIPIVFVVVSDPVGSGFVASLPRPGGNITGFVNLEASLSGKWIELLKSIVPGLKRVALMYNPQTAPYSHYYLEPFEAAAKSYGLESVPAAVHSLADIERLIARLAEQPGTGLALMADNFMATRSSLELIIAQAARHRVPTVYPYRYMATPGGLISYGIDLTDLYRRAPAYVDRILRGANPADLPVQLPTKFEMVVNLTTAKALGIEIPASLLGRADEVIE